MELVFSAMVRVGPDLSLKAGLGPALFGSRATVFVPVCCGLPASAALTRWWQLTMWLQGLPMSLGPSGHMAWHNVAQHTACWMGTEEKPILA